MKFHSLIIGTLAVAFLVPSMLLAGSIPSGAKKLNKNKIFQATDLNGKKFFCGKISKNFIPGRKVSGLFYSHQAEIKNLQASLKKTKNKKKKQNIKNQIAKLKEQIATRKDICLGALRFDFSGAVGVAISEANTSNVYSYAKSGLTLADSEESSNLKKVDSFGNLKEAVVSGKAKISQYFIAPNSKLYVLFQNKININNTEDTACSGEECCLLAEVETTSGHVLCIDSTLDSINWTNGYGADRPIQFDKSGAIYYLGYSAGSQVLRKYISTGASTFTNLTSAKMIVSKFLVLDDGGVLISGKNENSEIHWLRKIPASGKGIISLVNSPDGEVARNMNILSDGYIYIDAIKYPANEYYHVARFKQNFESIEDIEPWIKELSAMTTEECQSLTYAVDCRAGYKEHCSKDKIFKESLDFADIAGYSCYSATVPASYISPMGKVFAVIKLGNTGIEQWYPKFKSFNFAVKTIESFYGVGESLILSGLDANMKEQITIYNTDTDEELQLLEPGRFSPYSFIYIAASNTIMFDALRYEDNEYVIGQINLATREVTSVPAGNTSKLVNFQALN